MYPEYKRKILSFHESRRRMPSYGEIASLLGFKSKNAAAKLVAKMVDEGAIAKDAGGKLIPRHLGMGAPLLGLVEAGFPSAAEEELLDVLSFDEYLIPNKEAAYILKVKGDSMAGAGIMDGDMVIVERRHSYKVGQIVVAMIDGEYTMKYLRKKAGRYYLEPANLKYQPIYPGESFRVEAVVTALVRKY